MINPISSIFIETSEKNSFEKPVRKNFEKETENFSTGSSDDKDKIIFEQPENQRFCLRKRKSVNYNTKTKKFEYESDSDSDYEQKPKNCNKG
jgi:hypothetical protein